ncbi:trifunctional serine/threonine-protein kinase/ATP-binding protein/sensor histidine kinase [Dapis sp. BLCC M229]|uniref:trifunctional serine/threonine-protein kinase/ATP-binding protein/sensor histidine kinase n=1 Tax=Dapis sp. BLCC M229 TaxID=3400188 RepID=UPI003CF27EF8
MIETKTIKIGNYQSLELIHESDRTLVYRAQNVENGQQVIIKLMRNQYPSFRELVQFRNQYAISKNLEIEGIIKIYGLERYEHRYAMIMEDMGGVSLAEYEGKSSFCIPEFLDIAIQLSEILHLLHNNSIVHKDIKPANILIHPETKQVKLIDFSISSLLPKEIQSIQTPNVLEGTLAYLSPEQTGRMNRAVDYRSDFYSLGVTFYELLMGTLPFSSDDALELIHAHMAFSPEPLSESVVLGGDLCLPTLSDIVLKLMAKNAEQRYQSALGLKYDLEKCRIQYLETGKIEPFKLGERDICDRFIIPEKLYGREKEVQALLDCFERVTSPLTPLGKGGRAEMMLVAGYSGIGKTAVINEVHKPIVRQRGYFIKGKFDQFNRNIPLSAFVIAFRSLMGQIFSESDGELQEWKTKILEAVGSNGQVMIEVIPELERIIGSQPPVPDLSGSAAQNRFNLVMGKFVRVFTAQHHPLVIFLDDLQWADSASLNLLKLLIAETETGYLLVLGAYRDNEVFPAHPLMLTLDEIQKQGANLNTLTLDPLSALDINYLVADTLFCEGEVARPLSQLVYEKTQGNPFFTTQFLRGLHGEGCITFDLDAGYWQCNLTQVRQLALTDDVVEFMVGQLRKLPQGTQDVLKLGACIGNRFDLATLAIVCEESQDEVAADLWLALQEGLLIPESETYKFFQRADFEIEAAIDIAVNYRFLHDRVQQAAYTLIPEDRKQRTHLTIGRLLLHNTSTADLDDKLFDVVNQLNKGNDLIVEQKEKQKLCELNLQAGRKAKAATAYKASSNYLLLGIGLLEPDSWNQHYELTLGLYEAATESAYLNGDFEKMEELGDIIIKNSRTLLDTVITNEIKIQALQAQSLFREAIDLAVDILKQLGVREFPEKPDRSHTELWLEEVQRNLGDRSPLELLDLPLMTDANKIAAMRILGSIAVASYITNPLLFILMVFERVNLSINYGHAPFSDFSYAGMGLVLCGVWDKIDLGYQFGELAIELAFKHTTPYSGRAIKVANAQVKHYKEPIRDTLKGFKTAYSMVLESGDLEFVGYTALHYSFHCYLSGKELSELDRELLSYSKALDGYKQYSAKNYIDIYRQVTHNLLKRSENLSLLVGNAYNEEKMLSFHEEANDLTGLYYIYLNRGILCYLFQDYDRAFESLEIAEKYLGGAAGTILIPIFHFYRSLVAIAKLALQPETEHKKLLEKIIATSQERLNHWSSYAPSNYLHKCCLIEAEKHQVVGNKTEAMEMYDRAIVGAKENEYIQEEALANELAAKFYLNWGKEKIACTYMQEAYYCYAQWGAKAKTDQLEERYPQFLSPILQQQQLSFTANSKITTLTKATVSQTNTSTGELLDLATLMKASRSLSQEIDLNRAIANFIQIIQENAGAETVALMLFEADTLMLTAYTTKEEMSVISIPVEQSHNLPLTLINRVKNTREHLVLEKATEDNDYGRDDYIEKYQPQSVLCLPLIDRGQLRGILYLENNQVSGAFTSDRIEILNLLCSQAAISLENAQLYNNLEIKVQERTAELSQALENLKQTQKQLVESEKMASLGGLVAGVAHEINTPVGTSITVASTLNEETQAFGEVIAKGQLKRSVLNDYIETCTECTQLIVDNLQRAGELIGSFKQVAVDQTNLEIRTFGIKAYLEEVLTSLMPNIRQQGHQVNIEGDENLKITTYPGALAQIVTNLTNNSLVHAYPDGQTGQLNWRIELAGETLIIEYTDDGCGITEAELSQIFEPFYTTARNQGGTGLGLHIVYNLVTQKLQGTICANSQLGEGVKFTLSIPQ